MRDIVAKWVKNSNTKTNKIGRDEISPLCEYRMNLNSIVSIWQICSLQGLENVREPNRKAGDKSCILWTGNRN